MVVGFNHNFSYKGRIYHIQTEDGGVGSPNIVTLLYHGGTILASRKTSYADIAKVDSLDQVVEELMKEQHKGMLRSLKNGEFDEAIIRYEERVSKPASETAVSPPVVVAATAPPVVASQIDAIPTAGSTAPAGGGDSGLDEIVVAYLLGEAK